MNVADLEAFSNQKHISLNYVDYLDTCDEIVYQGNFHQQLPNHVIQYHCPAQTENIIVFADSFGEHWRSYLFGGSNNLIYIWKYSHFWRVNEDLELLLAEIQPTIVIEIMVERNLSYMPPAPSP